MTLLLNHIDKRFGDTVVYKDFSMRLEEGLVTCLLGPSGCGKTTLLNMIAQVDTPDAGTLDGFAGKRFSYVFQEPRLLPWKTVEDNIGFVVDRSLGPKERKERVDRVLRWVGLSGQAKRYPSQLSGGQCQRVSIARAFAVDSDIILMDEPFSGLDPTLKSSIMEGVMKMWEADRRTVVCVTHDIDEALLIGHRVLVLSQPPSGIVFQGLTSGADRASLREAILNVL